MRTRVDTDAQIFLDQRPTTGASLTGVPGVDLHHATTSTFRLVRRVVDQLTPSSIGYALGETVVLEHPVNIQVLEGNDAKLVHQLATEFVGKISAAVRDALVYLGDNPTPPSSFGRTLLGLAQLALGACQSLLVLAEEARIRDMFTRTERGERVKPNVNTNSFRLIGQRLGFDFTREASVPIARSSTANGERLDLALKRPMEDNLHVAYLGQRQAVVFQLEPELWIRETVVARGRPKARIPWRLTSLDAAEKRLERKVNTLLGVLQDLGVRDRQECLLFLPAREHLVGGVQIEAFLTFFPRRLADLKRLVVDPTRGVQSALEKTRLGLRRVQSVLESLYAHKPIISQWRKVVKYWAKAAKARRFLPGLKPLGFRA